MTIHDAFAQAAGWGFFIILATGPAPLGAQASTAPLTLTAALREGERATLGNRIAVANAAAASAQASQTLRGVLPSLRVEAVATRTTDPIGAFGAQLRQRSVTAAAFDPARLNNPAAISTVQGGVVIEMPLLNADAWAMRRSAQAAASASTAAAQWAAVGVRSNIIRAWYGAVLASAQVRMLTEAKRAADAAVRQVQAMVQQGLVTKADALQASVRALEIAAQALSARNEAQLAREQLALLIGRTDGSAPLLPDTLGAEQPMRAVAVRDTLAAMPMSTRADVLAARSAADAAHADRDRAVRTLLPRLNGFARSDWFAATAPFAGRPAWTVGVLASWSVFGGGSELADLDGTTARSRAADAGRDAAAAQQRLETTATRRAIALALARLDLATLAADQSIEAQRLVQKRYAGGLATIAEVLNAEATATGKRLAQAGAQYALIDALVAHRQATGADPGDLQTLAPEQ